MWSDGVVVAGESVELRLNRLVAAARTALPSPEAVVARQVLAADLALLADLDVQILAAEAHMARLWG